MTQEHDQRGGGKLTGGEVDYYLVIVNKPQRADQPPYRAECGDIIRALGMTFDEGNAFKALWRLAAGRMSNGKPGQAPLYDAEKVAHYGGWVLSTEIERRTKDDT